MNKLVYKIMIMKKKKNVEELKLAASTDTSGCNHLNRLAERTGHWGTNWTPTYLRGEHGSVLPVPKHDSSSGRAGRRAGGGEGEAASTSVLAGF